MRQAQKGLAAIRAGVLRPLRSDLPCEEIRRIDGGACPAAEYVFPERSLRTVNFLSARFAWIHSARLVPLDAYQRSILALFRAVVLCVLFQLRRLADEFLAAVIAFPVSLRGRFRIARKPLAHPARGR